MKDSLYLSRSFVEFGPFSSAEMQDFHKRGILKDSDYVSADASGAWLHVNEWAATLKTPAEAKAPAAPKAAKAPASTPAPAPVSVPAPAPAPAKKAVAKKSAKKA